MDAKQACDKLNGFNFQNRYLVGTHTAHQLRTAALINISIVLYHQPEKMARSKDDLAERQEHLEQLKRQHGID